MKIKKYVSYIFRVNWLYTIFFNLYYRTINGFFNLPIIVCRGTKIGGMGSRNSVIVNNGERVIIGNVAPYSLGEGNYTYWNIKKEGVVIFGGKATISRGTIIDVKGKLCIGSNFWCNANCMIVVYKKIEIGKGCLLGWNVTVKDDDGHPIYMNDKRINEAREVLIGDSVWIGAEACILKGAELKNMCVVGAKAVVSKRIELSNVIVVGSNLVAKKGIWWKMYDE